MAERLGHLYADALALSRSFEDTRAQVAGRVLEQAHPLLRYEAALARLAQDVQHLAHVAGYIPMVELSSGKHSWMLTSTEYGAKLALHPYSYERDIRRATALASVKDYLAGIDTELRMLRNVAPDTYKLEKILGVLRDARALLHNIL